MSWKEYVNRYNYRRSPDRSTALSADARRCLDEGRALDLEDRSDLLEAAARVFDGTRSARFDDSSSARARLEAVADSVGTLGLQRFEALVDLDRLRLAKALVELYGPSLLDLVEDGSRRTLVGASQILISPSDLAELELELEAAGVLLSCSDAAGLACRSRPSRPRRILFRRGERLAAISPVEIATSTYGHLRTLLEASGILEAAGSVVRDLVDEDEDEPRDSTAHEIRGDGSPGMLRRSHALGLLDADQLEAALEAVAGRQLEQDDATRGGAL